jgi:uncharacterized pyridoxamine 5'-phosphate oxidase family protein
MLAIFSLFPSELQSGILENLDYHEIDNLCSLPEFSNKNICGKSSKPYKTAFDRLKRRLPKNMSMLTYAASTGNLSLVKRAVGTYGYSVDGQNYAAFVEATKAGHLDILKYLIEQNGENPANLEDLGLLEIAIERRYNNIVKYLYDKFYWITSEDKKELFKQALENDNFELVQLFAPNKFNNIDLVDKAVDTNNLDIIKFIVANYNITDGEIFERMVRKSIDAGYLHIVKYLIGINPNILRRINYLEMDDTVDKDVLDFLAQIYDSMPNYDSDYD